MWVVEYSGKPSHKPFAILSGIDGRKYKPVHI